METIEQKECQEPLELINFVKKEGLSHQVINNIVILYVPNSISDFSFILFYDRYKFKYPMSPKDALKVLKCETFHIETELIRFIYVNEIEQKDIINTNSLSLVDRNRNYISYLFFYSKF